MRCLDQVVGVIHAGKDGHSLNGDHELCILQVSVEVLGKLHEEGEDHTHADIVYEADQHHANVPTELVPIIVIKLKKRSTKPVSIDR